MWMIAVSASDKAVVSFHPVHISRCYLNYNEQDSAFQISCFIFLEDLQDALLRKGVKKLKLGTSKESPDADRHILSYFQQHFQVKLDGQKADYAFVGREISKDFSGFWCYFEIGKVAAPAILTVKNDLLLELFDDQQNIVFVTIPHRKEGYLVLQKGHTEESINY